MGSRVFLSGPMGVGKSTAAHSVAEHLGYEAIDLDAEIERVSGRSVAELFGESEAAFRAVERDCIQALMERDMVVVALGGGTVVDRATRHALLRAGTLITLRADLETLLERVGSGEGRPLLKGDPRGRLARLLEDRADAYAECTAVLEADDDLPRRVSEIHTRHDVVVPLGRRTYRVEIGHGIRDRLAERVDGYSKIFVITDENASQWRVPVSGALEIVLAPGEVNKTVASVETIWDRALAAGCDRNACVVALGGGVVGDLAGFAAATLMRGVAFGQVPTTLLAMVDSSVGGKTGFNRAAGKNLVGAFHQPRFVLCDVDTLQTLPETEVRAAFAEVVKSAWIAGEDAVTQLERDADVLVQLDPAALEAAIRMSVRLKAEVVADDEREAGRRRVLNLGHTIGHAIEAARGYGALRHGEAVALGLVATVRVSRRVGAMSVEQGERLLALLARLGLPTDLDAHLDLDLETFVGSDKKRSGDRVHFVLAGPPGSVWTEPMAPFDVVGAL